MEESLEFSLVFPVWVFVLSPDGEPDIPGFGYADVVCGRCQGIEYLLTFTDESLLPKFRESFPLPDGVEPVAFSDPLRFVAFIRDVLDSGRAAHLALDAWGKGVTAAPFPIEDVIAQLSEQIGGGESTH